MIFQLDTLQYNAFVNWARTLEPDLPTAIGGRFTFAFTDTSIGQIVTVTDGQTGATLDLTGEL